MNDVGVEGSAPPHVPAQPSTMSRGAALSSREPHAVIRRSLTRLERDDGGP